MIGGTGGGCSATLQPWRGSRQCKGIACVELQNKEIYLSENGPILHFAQPEI